MLEENSRTILKIVGVVMIFCIVIVGILCLDRILTPAKSPADTFEQAKNNLNTVSIGEQKYLRKNIETYLIIGLDSKVADDEDIAPRYQNGNNADFVMLLAIDKSNREIFSVNINRDTWLTADALGSEGWTGKIDTWLTLAYNWGDGGKESANNVRRAVNRLFENVISIDHYITLKMDAVKIITDYINGHENDNGTKITMTISGDMTEINPEWKLAADEKTKEVIVTGEDAMKLVRQRDTSASASNVDRIAHQSMFINALLMTAGKKNWSYSYLTGIINELSSVEGAVFTDHANDENLADGMEELLEMFGMFNFTDIIDLVPAEEGSNRISYGYYDTVEYHGVEYDRFNIDQKAIENLLIEKFLRKIED